MRARSILALLAVLIILGGVYFIVSRFKATEPVEPTIYVWDVEDSDLVHITISLPRQDLSQAFIKIPSGDQFPWFFDDPQHSPIDVERWGGGIPLLLSGPSADRVIAEYASAELLARYGLASPSMVINLTLTDESTILINVGDATPNGVNYYVKAPASTAVATVDFTWYDVLASLVTDPPYATPDSDEAE